MSSSQPNPNSFRAVWRENGGNILVAFLLLILAGGTALLAYNQLRFVPPKFPSNRSIHQPPPDVGNGVAMLAAEGQASMKLQIIGAANANGSVLVAVYGSAESFNDPVRALISASAPIQEGLAQLVIPVGEFPDRVAIAAYHDENDDGTLNVNAFGVPVERYGFSNYARGLLGPPTFDEAAISGPFEGRTLEIVIR